MPLLLWIMVFSLLGSIGSLGGAALLLAFPEAVRKTLVPCLVSYATGTLLGAAFLGMIPNALRHVPAVQAMGTVLAGMLLFFVLEKLVIWRHCHDSECDVHGAAGPLVLFGDALHNFIDGVVIAAAFMTSVPLGITTSIAVIAHEVPQEVGDFGILLDSGYAKLRAFIYNGLSSLATLPGAVLAYVYLESTRAAVPYILALSAASFIYISSADLMPALNRRVGLAMGLRQFLLILAGIGTIAILRAQH